MAAQIPTATSGLIELSEFIYDKAPFPSAHASTIVETTSRTLIAAWFGGSSEGAGDVQVCVSRKPTGQNWSTPIAVTETPGMPAWNPVLFQNGNKTWLFFKIGPSPREWVGGYRTSENDGVTWSPVTYLPAGLSGPIRTKLLVLTDGTWLAGTSVEAGYRADTPPDAPYRSWAVWVERSTDRGDTWMRYGPITVPGQPYGVIQPTLWQNAAGVIRMFMRSTERIGRIVESSSIDGGRTWSPGNPTGLPNPNAGIDVTSLRDGRLVLIYNHLPQGRKAIHLAVSRDDGKAWSAPITLEEGEGEYSYPAVIQTADSRIHVTYTWKRTHIRHLVVDPDKLPR